MTADEVLDKIIEEGGLVLGNMTLRDHLASKAMQSFIVSVGWTSNQERLEEIAKNAYRQADAMLKIRGEN